MLSRSNAIEELHKIGLNIIPLQPKSKVPLVSWKEYQDKQFTDDIYIDCNLAVICGKTSGNLVVIDIDKKLPDYIDGVLNGALEKTLVVETGKGYHIYLRCDKLPNTLRLSNKDLHVDVQSQGTFVVGPTSIHPDTGKEYKIISKTNDIYKVDFKKISLNLEFLKFKVEKPRATLDGVQHGGRNDAMFKLSCKLLSEYDVDTSRALVQTVNEKNTPPLPDIELETLFNSALTYSKNNDEVIITSIQNLNPNMYGKSIKFDCIIMAIGPRKAFIKEATYICPKCTKTKDIKCDDRRNIDSPKCTTRGCSQEKLKIVSDTVVTEYIQNCMLQEPLDQAKNSSPVIFNAKLIGGHVGEAFISQKKKIIGIFNVDIDEKKAEKDIYIDIVNMESLDDTKLCMPSDADINMLREASKKHGWMDKLCKSFAPTIYGYRDIKESLLLTLVSSHEITHEKRGWVNMFMVGDPSMAKSKLLEFAFKVTPKSIYTSGKGTSAAGLTIGMVKQSDGTSVMMAGVYPTVHKGFACLDEFDKMSKDDRSSMHEVMEQGNVSRALAGATITLPAMVSTIAAANPRYGSYDLSLSLKDNLYLPSTILTRFDIIWLLRDKVDSLLDTKKASHILKYFEEGNVSDDVYLDEKNLSAYLNYARQLRPKLTKGAGRKLMNIYNKLREASQKQDGLPVSMRQFESLIRLTLNHAKLYFKNVADEEDVDEIIRLMRESYASMGVKVEISGNTILFSQEKKSKDQKFIHAFKACKDEAGLVSMRKLKDYLAEADDWAPEDVEKTFWKFKGAGNIIDQANSLYKWV